MYTYLFALFSPYFVFTFRSFLKFKTFIDFFSNTSFSEFFLVLLSLMFVARMRRAQSPSWGRRLSSTHPALILNNSKFVILLDSYLGFYIGKVYRNDAVFRIHFDVSDPRIHFREKWIRIEIE